MRLSFLRILLRSAERGAWRFERTSWTIDERGVGTATYRVATKERHYTLVAFAHDLPAHMRSDRVIATAWDATFALFDGEPGPDDIGRLAANVPLQEAGRITRSELTLSRANRSVRLFEHVVESLAAGRQPDRGEVEKTGYLMRTTAVYGAGKFGAADRTTYAGRPELVAPFQAEMLTVWLIRWFTVDLAEHLARARGGSAAATLDPSIARSLGVGNSTGLGMAPFLVRHPVLLHRWIEARETALARVRALRGAEESKVRTLRNATDAAITNAAGWRTEHPVQQARLGELRRDLATIADWLDEGLSGEWPWDRLWRRGEAGLGLEGQEALLALMLEPHGSLVDDLADTMHVSESRLLPIDGTMTVAAMRAILRDLYDWALAIDFDDPRQSARFWYVSQEKLEPRLGDRALEPGSELEQPLCVGRMARELDAALSDRPPGEMLAAFLLSHPEHRGMVRRAQILRDHPFAEIRENLIAEEMLPIDILRGKLAFFGASRFDPRSDRWVRINLFADAPFPSELGAGVLS